MNVKYIHEQPGLSYGNIIWAERDRGDSYYSVSRYAMKNGKFPPDHPCSAGVASSNKESEFGSGGPLQAFRERGYWASCFPEGDGITMKVLKGQDADTVRKDIAECFGWTVESEVQATKVRGHGLGVKL